MSGRDKSVRRVPRSAGIVEQGELQVHAHHEPCGLQVGALPAAAARAKPGMALRQRRAAPGAQAGACLLQRDLLLAEGQIGRASWREKVVKYVEILVVA